jgi:hypothetical protein
MGNHACGRKLLMLFAKQAELGIDVVSDGEYGKAGWIRYVAERLGGFVHRPNPISICRLNLSRRLSSRQQPHAPGVGELNPTGF